MCWSLDACDFGEKLFSRIVIKTFTTFSQHPKSLIDSNKDEKEERRT